MIVADTVKGRGVDFMEGPALKDGELYGYHSGAPSEPNYLAGLDAAAGPGRRRPRPIWASAPSAPRRRSATRGASRGRPTTWSPPTSGRWWRRARSAPTLIALDADLIKDCGLVSFARRFPDRFIECGIAEQDMVSMAGGMARRGALPVVHSFACFLAARPNEQIYNQCSEHSKVVYVGSLAGLLPGGPGHSHQSVRDISALAAVPDLVMAEPSVEAEVAPLFDHLLEAARERVSAAGVGEVADAVCVSGRAQPRVGQGWIARDGARRADLRLRSVDAGQRVSGRRGSAAARRHRGARLSRCRG